MFTNLWTVKLGDFGRGLVIAVLTAPITILYDVASTGSLTLDWKKMVAVAIAGCCGYLLKNLLTGQNGNILTNK